MKESERAALLKGVTQALTPYIKRIAALELERDALYALATRVDSLETGIGKSLADTYRGTFLSGTAYERGQTLTHSGHLWLCMARTKAIPGDGADWKLIVKGSR